MGVDANSKRNSVRSVIAGTVTLEPILLLVSEISRWLFIRCIRLPLALAGVGKQRVADNKAVSAFITGCDTGIGRETAVLLAQKGWRVFAGVLTEVGAKGVMQTNPAITPVFLDVTKDKTINEAAAKVSAAVGGDGLQLLVNNAGLMQLAAVECCDLAAVRKVLEVNVLGVFAVTQAFLPLLRSGQQKGRIINMGSVSGHMPLPFWGAYSATKHALEGLTDCLRFEVADQGIKVVLIKPGPIKTALWNDLDCTKRHGASSVMTSPEMNRLYGHQYRAMLHEADKAGVAAIPVSEVVQVIYEAATSPQPKLRYHVGPNAAAFCYLKRISPEEPFYSMVTKYLAREYNRSAPTVVDYSELDFVKSASTVQGVNTQ